MLHSFISIQP